MLARGMVGMMDASTTRRFWTARSRQCWSIDGHRIVRRPHPRRAAGMKLRGHGCADVCRERLVRAHCLLGQQGDVVGVAGDLRLVRDLPREADACHEPPQVLRVGGEVELDHAAGRAGRCSRATSGRARAGVRARRAARSRAACRRIATACGPPMPATSTWLNMTSCMSLNSPEPGAV